MLKDLIVEVKINIFQYVPNILCLALTCKAWAEIMRDPHARARWILRKYGRSYALFHSIRLGPQFINVSVVQSLFANNVILSRYFIQRLVMHFGEYDSKLTELKAAQNGCAVETNKIRDLTKRNLHPWASNLPVD
ncbi:6059_t:CDS:1, partial [Acaulospora morrowiae]